MLYLDAPTKKIEVVLAGSVSANQLEISSFYFDHAPQATTTLRRGGQQRATSNNTTDVTIVDAPAAQQGIRNVHTIAIHNRDTATATVTVKIDDNGTETILVRQALQAGDSLTYEDGSGWVVLTPITAPFVDTTLLVKGSSDATKFLRIEVDGLTSGTTRVWTAADADIKPAGHATGLTATRIPYATGATGGVLTDSAALTFDGTTLATTNLDATGTLVVDGNATLGDAVGDSHTINGALAVNDDGDPYTGTRYSANTSGAYLVQQKSRHATLGSHTIVQSGDQLGGLIVRGSDGTAFRDAAYILVECNGTPGSSDMPGAITFWTTPDGSATPTQRWQITNSGHLIASTDNSWDIGASGATRPRNVFIAGTLTTGGNATLGDAPGSDSHTVNGVLTIATTGGNASFVAGGSSRDSLRGFNLAAGSGFNIDVTNAAGSDYEPLGLFGEFISLNARTGVFTAAEIARVTSADLIFPTDNTYDIGASGATRPRDIFLGRNFTSNGLVRTTGGDIQAERANTGNDQQIYSYNTDNTDGASNAFVRAITGGASGGDPKLIVTVNGVVDWSLGIDNSDSDKFKIGPNIAVGTSSALVIDTSGNILSPALTTPAFTGNPTGTVTSGTYTPTLTNVNGIDASTAFECQYLRVGNVVTVSGMFHLDITAGSAELGISLPISSNFGAEEDLGGTGVSTASNCGRIWADTANDRATLFCVNLASDTSNRPWAFHFTYQVI